MLNKIKIISSWSFSAFFFILFLAAIAEGISCIFFLGLSMLLCPPVNSWLKKHHVRLNFWSRTALGAILLVLGMALLPQDGNASTEAFKQKPVEAENPETGSADGYDNDITTPVLTPAASSNQSDASGGKTNDASVTVPATPVLQPPENDLPDLKVHFIDVGQGDSIFIESAGHFMLIDAGENTEGDTVVNYLKDRGVKNLDYVIGTHPHSDHIGGLDTVINTFAIDKILLPDVTHTTDTFEDVLDAIDAHNLAITKPVAGSTYTLGTASFTILAPNGTGYNDLNNYSIGIKLTNGKNNFLLAGDAEILSEEEMLHNGIDLSADVLKLGHHGSDTSSSESFLDAVSPAYAVISVGADNDYGHPHPETLQKMQERGILLYRTDKQGTIIFHSDGEKITVNGDAYHITDSDLAGSNNSASDNPSDKGNVSSPDKNSNETVIVHITETGSKYHTAGCRYLQKSDMEVTLEEALDRGLKPCGVCDPPTK